MTFQQGNKSKGGTEKAVQNNTKNSIHKTTEPVKPVIVTQSASRSSVPVNSNGDAKPVSSQSTRSSGTSNGKTLIQVQSLRSNSPRLQMGKVNGANNDETNRLSFGEKKDIVSSALPLSHSASNLESLSPRTPVSNEPSFQNGKLGHVVMSKSRDDIDSVSKPGPMEEQRNKFTSSSADNVSKPDVVKSSIKPTKPAARVVMNADKQMIDLDSFTERKNMLSELKNFDKQLKPVQQSTGVSKVKVSIGEKQENKDSKVKSEPNKVNGEQTNPRSGFLGDIKMAKKPSELKEAKVPKDAQQTEHKTNSLSSSENQAKLFDDLLKGVNSDSDGSSSTDNSPREEVVYEPQKVKLEQEVKVEIPKGVDREVAPSSEISFAGMRQVTTIQEESDDNGTEDSEEDDRYVSEFQFPGKAGKSQSSTEATSKQKQGKRKFVFRL